MAAEFATSAAANAVGNLTAEYASPYVSYFFRYRKIVEEFKNQRKELEMKIDRVKNDVYEAIMQTEIIEKDVQDWLKRAEKELKETQSLEAEIEGKKCFNWCPSWGWQYCLTKRVAKKTPYLNKLLESSNFQRVGHRAPLQGIEFLPSKDFMPSRSSNSTFNEIIKALNTNGLNMIGLYGMPGVGKTTLAKEVGKHVKEKKLFDNVVMVTMSQTPTINKIQDKIAELFGLKFEASTDEGKAEELWRRLKGVKKILIIIDDVWNEFKLQTIGIPFGVEHEGCKILLTTRLQQVCVLMSCQEKFQLDIFSEDEAWALFKDVAGLEDDFLKSNDVTKEVACECNGLPLAIVTIGKALKGASLDGWRAANRRLKDSRHLDNEDVCEGIYDRLKLSYDYLKGDNIRLCFLLCSLFPEDCDIDIELLIMFGIGYGLFSNIYLIEDLRREICEVLRKLQESSLVLKANDGADDDENYVRMHDVVRDFSHWITSKEKNIFMVKEGLTEWPICDSFASYVAISFWNSNIKNFPEKLDFPNLKILVFTGKSLVKVPSTFVKGMKALRVLHLENVIFSLEENESVTNLRTLCFVDCKLENISWLRNLENLEILALADTNIYELPEVVVVLWRLKSLHFSHFGGQQSNFPPNLLSRLTSLQELHVTCVNNLNLSEINSLSRLTALTLRVSTAQCFEETFVFPKLQRYTIAVNQELGFMEGLTFRTLKIKDFSSSFNAFKELFCNVEKLALENVREHKNIVPDVDQEGLNELTSLQLRFCDDMECLIDTTGEQWETIAFSNLLKLEMEGMSCFKEFCHGLPPITFLQKLETLIMRDCLEPTITVPAQKNLREVSIYDCWQLQFVFQTIDGPLEKEESTEMQLLSNLTSLILDSLPKLESIWKEPTHHASLQSLKVVRIRNCYALKSIFSTCLAQSLFHLQQLLISYCDGLEQIFDFPQEMSNLNQENQVPPLSNLARLELFGLPKLSCIWKGPTHLANLQSLKTLRVMRCSELAYLFPTPLVQSLVHLEVLRIHNCDSLEHLIIEETEIDDEIVSDKDGYSLSWPKLKTLEISGCGSLKYVFPISLAEGLPHLESVEISDSPQLKQVFNMTKENGACRRQDIVLQRLQILKLENLENLINFCPENFLVSPSLKEFKVRNCPGLTQQVVMTLQAHLEKNQVPTLSNLTSLELELLPELEWIWKGLSHYVSLQSLKVVEISDCNKLKYLFSPSLAQSLVLLQQLKIEYCDGLEHITTELEVDDNIESKGGHLQSPLLPKLTYLEIHCCPSLEYVFKLPLAQGLPHLKSISITDSSKLKHVFTIAKENNEVARAFVLPRLQHLQLQNLINLSSFCLENYPIVSPSLEKLIVVVCPRLANFNIQQEVNKKIHLKELRLSNLEHDNVFDTIDCQMIFQIQSRQILSRIEVLHLKSIPQLQGPIQVGSLQYLRELKVSKCKRLKSLFSSTLARNLPQLTNLDIVECEELEEIIFMDQSSASSSQSCLQPISFPSLRLIWISGCSNMKSLLPISVTCSLSNLVSIRVKASKLEQVFGCQGELNAEGDQNRIVVPKLSEFDLSELPNLKSFAPIGYHLCFPSLIFLRVSGCPNLFTSFSKDSKHIVHAIEEVPGEVESNTAEGSSTMEETINNDIFWDFLDLDCSDTLPLYINVEEAENIATQ